MKQLILGTGLSGLVGSRVVELLDDEFEFENLDLTTGVDITNKTQVKTKIEQSRAEIVIHLAAFTDVTKAHQQLGDKKGLCYQLNVLGSRHVAQSCKTSGKHLIHISTDFIFDGQNPPSSGYTETDSPHPIEWYGQTKLWAEEAVAEPDAKHVIVRLSYPYRAHFPQKLDLVRKLIHKFKQGQAIPAFTDHIITPTFIDDIALALKAIIKKRPQGIFHVVGSSSLSDYQIASAIATVFNFDQFLIKKTNLAEFLKTAQRPYQKNLSMSNDKLKKELGISMSTFQQGLEKMKQQLE